MIALLLLLSAGETTLTKAEALKLVFPDADRVVEKSVVLGEETRERVRKRYGRAVSPSQRIFVGVRGGKVIRYAMIVSEITKTLPATFIVGVSAEGGVTEVAVMDHREHVGTDCRRDRYLRQFRGRTNDHVIRVGGVGGQLRVNGATMSCRAVANGVRKAVAIVRYQFLDPPERAREAPDGEPVARKRYVMGSFCTITSHGGRAAVEEAFAAMKRLDQAISNYDPKSELSRLHRERSLEASGDLLEFVTESKRYAERSGSAFEATVAPLVALWGFKDGACRVPGDAEIRSALERTGSSRIRIGGSRITLPEGMELDPGAIGKGMAVDRAVEKLRKAGVKRALIDFGSTAFAMGSWEMAVRDPRDPEKTLCTLSLRDEALSSSGNYEKFFEKDGVRYSHIIDPRTGRSVTGVAGVSLIAPTATEADAMSTVVFVRGRLPDGLAAVVVTTEGRRKRARSGGPG